MDSDLTRLTVFFEAPFWVGIFERIEGDTLSVCKVTFGAEPKDYEVLAYVLKNYSRLRFSPSVAAAIRPDAANPKRMQRQIRKQTAAGTVGTRSQQALQLQREENRLPRKTASRAQREAEKQRQFDLKQQKRKEKHRGHLLMVGKEAGTNLKADQLHDSKNQSRYSASRKLVSLLPARRLLYAAFSTITSSI